MSILVADLMAKGNYFCLPTEICPASGNRRKSLKDRVKKKFLLVKKGVFGSGYFGMGQMRLVLQLRKVRYSKCRYFTAFMKDARNSIQMCLDEIRRKQYFVGDALISRPFLEFDRMEICSRVQNVNTPSLSLKVIICIKVFIDVI
ncbi:hypothetical protein CDAR_318001 [Caerostris darwini]|uniref:Uncharacterized protein n=1 Tax=Caerostris darwini TaxID=1538125 RepID=A0AAV4WU54_9ARAC|nr:hypothetical protein CDAR_318001 [Caerostris darwini]